MERLRHERELVHDAIQEQVVEHVATGTVLKNQIPSVQAAEAPFEVHGFGADMTQRTIPEFKKKVIILVLQALGPKKPLNPKP